MCGFETIINTAPDLFTEAEIDAYIKNIFNGVINLRSLSVANYQKVAERIMSGAYKGYGKHINDVLYLSPDYNMLRALKQNVHIFSGAKEYQQVRQMSSFLTDGDKIKSFSEFKKQVMPVFETYNKNYLNAEYNSAILQSRSASQWQTITEQQGLFPLLQYQTVEDGRVRPEHAALNGIIKPVNDPFWDKYMPQNGWNCRCDVTQLDEGKITDTSKLVVENVPPLFQFNPGKEQIIFSKEHPYFDVAKKDKDFAKQNFNFGKP